MKLQKKIAIAAITLLVGGLGFASVAQATSGSGTTIAGPASTGVLSKSAMGPTKAKQDGVTLKTLKETKVTTFDLTYPPGSFSGWHAHPGIVIAVVKSGSVVRQTGCKSETFIAGESFTEVGSHYVSNPGSVDAVLSITRIYPSSGTLTPRIDEPAPDCEYPLS